MIQATVTGAGRMGLSIQRLADGRGDIDVVHLWRRGEDLAAAIADADVVIDFSLPEGLASLLVVGSQDNRLLPVLDGLFDQAAPGQEPGQVMMGGCILWLDLQRRFEESLCGVISQRDLFRGALLKALGYGSRAEELMLNTVAVKEAMRENPYTTTPDTSLAEAARTMIEHGVGCLPVVEGGNLVGLLTEGDFVRLTAGRA